MTSAFALNAAAGKRLAYHQPGAVKPKVNLFDRTPASYGKAKIVTAKSGGIGHRGALGHAGLAHWTGPFGGPSTNGEDDFLTDGEAESRIRAHKAAKMAEKREKIELHELTAQAGKNDTVKDGPRLRKFGSHAVLVLKTGERINDTLLTRTVPLKSAIKFYAPLPGDRSTVLFQVKVKG